MQICFVYKAAIHCEDCGAKIADDLTESGTVDKGDSEYFPQGAAIGESDTPDHCDTCGVFLENPLTPDGVAYVRQALEDGTGNRSVLDTWREFYADELEESDSD